MMLLRFIFQASILGGLLLHGLDAVLDGRATIITVDSMYTFTDGEYALGFVHFNKGFTVLAGQVAYIGVIPRVNGPINLNETGTIYLSAPLRIGYASSGFINGGIIATSDGTGGKLMFDANTFLTKQLVFKNSMSIDLGQHVLTLRSNGGARGSLLIDNTVSQTLTLQHGALRGIEDFTTGYGPRLRGSSTSGGRHGYKFSDAELRFMLAGTMTMTNVDLIFTGATDTLYSFNSSLVHVQTSLFIDDLTRLELGSGVEMSLDTTLGSSYFSIGHGSTLALDNATFSYNKALTIPSPYLPKDMVSNLIISGSSSLAALGVGAARQLTIGGGSSYDYDAVVDIAPRALLGLDNVALTYANNHMNR